MAESDEQGITPAIEDYVKTIALAQQQDQKVNTNLVATRLDVSAASVTKVFQRLQQLELIEYTRYYGVTLTETGQQLAHAVLRRNRLVSTFLMKVLGFTYTEVQADADVLEHVISDALEQRIATYLGVQYEEDG
jgi:DtxR family Mn-dependent transcriptional regulator